jgi:hypothetical protein
VSWVPKPTTITESTPVKIFIGTLDEVKRIRCSPDGPYHFAYVKSTDKQDEEQQ